MGWRSRLGFPCQVNLFQLSQVQWIQETNRQTYPRGTKRNGNDETRFKGEAL